MKNMPPKVIRRQELARAISRDCDCACPDVVPTLAEHCVATSRQDLRPNPRLQSISLSTDSRVAFVPSAVTDGIAVLNKAAWDVLSCFSNRAETPMHLQLSNSMGIWGRQVVEDIIAEFVKLRFLVSENAQETSFIERPNTLTAWLHVTDRCNLRCSYCYLPHHRVDMEPGTGRAAVDATFRSALQNGYQRVKIKYAGGEPLLRFPVLAEIHRYAQTMVDRTGIQLEGVVLSNGTLLTAQMVREMQTLNLHLMISLDELHDAHNHQRRFVDGRDSSASARSAIEQALLSGLKPDVSVTISARNVAELPSLLEWILERDLPFGLNFYRENDLSATQDDLQLEEDQIIAGMLTVYETIEANLPRRSLLGSLIDRANLSIPHVRTCGAGHSYLVFDHKGKVAKCQMAMHETITSSDDGDPLQSVRLSQRGVINLTVKEKQDCHACEWQNWCAGGCPLATYRTTGRYNAASPFCNIYKALFPAVIRLEGLRLLQYQQF